MIYMLTKVCKKQPNLTIVSTNSVCSTDFVYTNLIKSKFALNLL